jgi:thiol-disulfide isomerase/thioredoxin
MRVLRGLVGALAVAAALATTPLRAADGETGSFAETPGRPEVTGLSFTTLDGVPAGLEQFRGKLVLLNLWATWCAPCVREMPGIQKLHEAMAKDGLQVLALSEDRGAAHVVEPFLKENGLTALPVFLDAKSTAMKALKLRGLPTTLLIDRQGREIGRLEGDTDWSGEAAHALIKKYLKEQG